MDKNTSWSSDNALRELDRIRQEREMPKNIRLIIVLSIVIVMLLILLFIYIYKINIINDEHLYMIYNATKCLN